MAITHLLASQVDLTTRARGNTYYRSGAVKIEDLSEWEVEASVQGSELYEVNIVMERQIVEAFCSCPYVEREQLPCKHIWAAPLAAEPRGFGANARAPLDLTIDSGDLPDGDDPDDDVDPNFEDWEYSQRQRNERSTTRRTAVPTQVAPGWKVQLDRLTQAMATAAANKPYTQKPPADWQLLYVVDVPMSVKNSKFVFEAMVQERKKDGDWSKPRTQSLSGNFNFVEPLDAQLVAILGGALRVDNYGNNSFSYYNHAHEVARYRLAGEILDTVLPLLAQSGRVVMCRVDKGELTPLVSDLDPLWELSVSMDKSSSGKSWVLAGNLRRGDTTMPLSQVDLIVPGVVLWDGRMGKLLDSKAFAGRPSCDPSARFRFPWGNRLRSWRSCSRCRSCRR